MTGDLYDHDFIGWTEEQARLLREAAARGTNLPLDWENLAEEVESLGRSELRELGSQLRRIVLHLWKLEFSPAIDPRDGWEASIDDARAEIGALLRSDPGLRPRLPGLLAAEAGDAARLAVKALHAYGEQTAAAQVKVLRPDYYTVEQVIGDWFPGRPDLKLPHRA